MATANYISCATEDAPGWRTQVSEKNASYRDPPLGRRQRNVRKWAPLVFLLIFLGVIISAVVLTGVFFLRSDKKTLQKHSLDDDSALVGQFNDNRTDLVSSEHLVSFAIDLSSFDPGGDLTYSLYNGLFVNSSTDGAAPATGADIIPVCIVIEDPSSVRLPVIISINAQGQVVIDQNTTSSNISTDGVVSKYPFDIYTSSLNYIAVSPTNSSIPCEDVLGDPATIDFSVFQPVVASIVFLSQELDGFDAHIQSALIADDDEDAIGPGTVQLTFTVRRRRVIQFFAVIMFAVTWLITIAIIIGSVQVMVYNKEARYDLVAASTALLFALPTIRDAEPGIPESPTVYDGNTFALIVHSIWYLHVDEKKEEAELKKDV
ncbi:hypothetical protein GGX14DRAFT_700613 [Mycena pura]|uniref:Transmembrane protein n=1 Tax=Mycena pura TaxID=153505 RepID=A0AAD6UXL2_9AGAR|nr:hypothetical protein GGX14DRAFT_700613 [Mycena pura]